MATHSSVLAWRIPGTAEPRVLLSMGSHRVGHDRSDLTAVDTLLQDILQSLRISQLSKGVILSVNMKILLMKLQKRQINKKKFLVVLVKRYEATIRTGHGTKDQFQIGKGVRQGFILTSYLFNFPADTSCKISGWINNKLESRLPGEISTSDMEMKPLIAESEEKLKSLLMRVRVKKRV